MLRDKSLTDLRSIAQGYGIADIFQKDKPQLLQAIELKQQAMVPKEKIEVVTPQYDPRVMTKAPARKSDKAYIEELLAPYTAKGLKLSFPEPEVWAMSYDKRNDTGTMRMPPRVVLRCADKVLNGQ